MSNEATVLRLVVLYADVSGSTRLYENFGDETARADIAKCLDILTASAETFEGRTIKTIGDEVMCTFVNPLQAARAAVEMHQALRRESAAGEFLSGAVRVKIGWHLGAAEWRGPDLIGEAAVVGQQVIGLAKAEEILASGVSLDALPAGQREDAQFIDTIESAYDGSPVEIFKLPWELGEDVTRFEGAVTAATLDSHSQLILYHAGRSIKLNEANRHCRVGRTEDNDLVVGGRFTSRHHAEINFRHGRFYVRDESINGTIVTPAEGEVLRLHREEGVLHDEGTIVFGSGEQEDTSAAVRYFCQ
jgi:adenylate cyclase